MRKTFNLFDANGDHKIEEAEFISTYIKINPTMGWEAALKEAITLFKAVDLDKNGSISFKEWVAAGITMKQKSPMKVRIGNEKNL
jgi:Ca2+-binding EF-hand superfamily protein